MIEKRTLVCLVLLSCVVPASAAPQQQSTKQALQPPTAAPKEVVEDKQTLAEEQRILDEATKKIAEKRKSADEQIARITGVAPSAVRDPYAMQRQFRGFVRPIAIPSGRYGSAFPPSFFEVNSINYRFESDKKAIEDDCKKRIAALREIAENARSQMRPGTSGVQATPIGSNAYVRNIVNYSDEQFHVAPQSAKAGVWTAPRNATKVTGHAQSK